MSENIKMTSLSFKKDYQKPDEERDRMYDFIKWGKKNDYPYFLVDLYNGSAWHQGIIKNKVTYIAGGGLESTSGDMTAFIENKYSEFDMNEIVEMLSYDYELFGGFCVMGTWNRDGSRVAVWEHIDLDMVRISEDGLTYYLSDDWTSMQQSPEKTNLRTISALDTNNKEGKFIIYYKDPSKKNKKEKGVYPKPPYYGGITAIQTDADISRFHMHEIANSFKSGTLISFVDGYPETYEEAEKIKQQVKGRSQSVEDAGEIVITFSDSKDKAPIVQQLNGNDLDKRYTVTEKSVQQNILVAHSVVAPSLFGVAPEGSFNASESADLFEVFKKTYVDARQRRIEWMLNYMVELSGYMGTIKLRDVAPIGIAPEGDTTQPAMIEPTTTDPDMTTPDVDVAKSALNGAQIASLVNVVQGIKDGILTPDSALNIVLASFPTIDEVTARKIVGMPNSPQMMCVNDTFSKDEEIDCFSEYGEDAGSFDVVASYPIVWDTPSEEVFSKQDHLFATIGEIKLGLKDIDKNVLSLLEKGEDSTAISKALEQPVEEIAKSIERLVGWDLYKQGEVTDLAKNLIEQVDIPADRYEIRYNYREIPGIPPVKTKSRDFCVRLVGLNRLYSRDEINMISGRVDRNVWLYRGGWYNNPETKRKTPWCRHEWVQQIVIRRS
jgi:hypothetical protein